MIKLLEDLLIEATTSPNVPGSLVAGLRKAVDEARGAAVPETVAPPTSQLFVRLIAGGGYEIGDMEIDPPPAPAGTWAPCDKDGWVTPGGPIFTIPDGLQVEWNHANAWRPVRKPRGADMLPSYRVCIKAHETNVGNTVPVGHVVTLEAGELLQQPECWLRCDKDGWVPLSHNSYVGPMGLKIKWRDGAGTSDWRPLPPKPSAIDEMAEQIKRWAAPTREDLEIQRKAHEEMWAHLPESVTSEEEIAAHRKRRDSKSTNPQAGLDATLAERGSRYGRFEDHSEVSQALKKVVFTKRPREILAADQVEALEMICHKLGRIVNGDPNYADSWVDIAGYAKLVADRLEGVSR